MRVLDRVLLKRMVSLLLLTVFVRVGWGAPVVAQDADLTTNRAGLVVVHDDGRVVSRCVGFSEENISGYDLLVRGGFAARTEVTSMGASVCSVDGEGCGEGEGCFCQCKSSPCVYWTYWQLLPDGWRYSNAGAVTVQVQDGDVQGWVWGESRPNAPAESAPPALAFADICSADAAIYGIEDETAVGTSVNVSIGNAGMVAVVVGVPLLLGGAWWLWQRRKGVLP